MAEATLRETLSATLDQASAPSATPAPSEPAAPSPAPATPASAPTTPAPPAAPGASKGDSSSQTPPAYLAPPTKPAAAPTPPAAPTAPGAAASAPPAATAVKVPQSWPVHIRDKWAGLPPEVQAQVSRREAEVTRVLQESKDARTHMEEFNKVSMPYRHLIDMEGSDPMKAYGDYLRTAAILRQGQPHMKAHMVASLVQQFGVDINTLDQYLSQLLRGGQIPQQGVQSPQHYQDPRVDQMFNYLTQQRQQQEFITNQRADKELEAFEADTANEFYNDVKTAMADLLDYNADRGVVMTLKEAYDTACAMNPNIRQALSQRQIASMGTPPDQLAAARAAASSIAPQFGGSARPPAPSEPTSVRGALEASIQKLSGGNRM